MRPFIYPLFSMLVMIAFMHNCQWDNTSAEKTGEDDTIKKKFNGEKKYYWENGKLKASIYYVDGLREGINKNYARTGRLMSEVPFSQNMINGISRQYYETGKLQSTITYVNDAKHGAEKWYYEDGTLYRESNFKYGKLDGRRVAFYENGKKMYEAEYKDGLPGSGLKEYEKNGGLKKQPYIVVEEINNVDLTGEYIVLFRLSDNASNAVFYAGDLTNGKFFHHKLSPVLTKNGKGKIVFNVEKGTFLMHTINVIAKKKTYMRNELILQKKVNIAIENR